MSDQTHAPQSSVEKMTASLKENREWLDSRLKAERSFDLIRREIRIGGRDACLYFIDGFCKDELMQKLLEFIYLLMILLTLMVDLFVLIMIILRMI